jgi:hypothetical protein
MLSKPSMPVVQAVFDFEFFGFVMARDFQGMKPYMVPNQASRSV